MNKNLAAKVVRMGLMIVGVVIAVSTMMGSYLTYGAP